MTRKVLVIAYYFPPVGGGGVQRTAKFVKYLHEFNWEPVVLTVKEEIYRKANRPIDYTLLDDIPKGVYISRTFSLDLANVSSAVKGSTDFRSTKFSVRSFLNKASGLLINPDAQMLWIPVAVHEGLRLIKKHNIDVLYSTANPWSDHIVGVVLKRITRLPWVADYRDAWTLNPYVTFSSKIRKNIQFNLERKVMESADRVVFTSEGTKNDYKEVFGNGKLAVIRNAFDPNDFTSIEPKRLPYFTILYSGNIWSYTKLTYFIIAVANWLKKNPAIRKEIMINVLGKIDDKTGVLIQKEELQNILYLRGYLSHKESLNFLLCSDVLLLTLDKGGESIIPAKLFEYLASGRMILALIPPSGKAAEILKKEARGDYIVNPGDVNAMERALMVLYRKYKEGHLRIDQPVKNLQSYTRKKATAKLSKVFDDLMART